MPDSAAAPPPPAGLSRLIVGIFLLLAASAVTVAIYLFLKPSPNDGVVLQCRAGLVTYVRDKKTTTGSLDTEVAGDLPGLKGHLDAKNVSKQDTETIEKQDPQATKVAQTCVAHCQQWATAPPGAERDALFGDLRVCMKQVLTSVLAQNQTTTAPPPPAIAAAPNASLRPPPPPFDTAKAAAACAAGASANVPGLLPHDGAIPGAASHGLLTIAVVDGKVASVSASDPRIQAAAESKLKGHLVGAGSCTTQLDWTP